MGFRMKGEDSPGFLALNRNKRSIALDLKSEADREILYALAKTADVIVENGRAGRRQAAGYRLRDHPRDQSEDRLRQHFRLRTNRALGPAARLRPDGQAMSGVISATGEPGGEPVKNGIPVGDLGAALFATYAILSAIIGRGRTGEGSFIDASLLEAALGLSVWETTELWGTGHSPQPIGTANRMSAPYQAVRASDGHFVLGAANQKLWLAFLGVAGREDLADDPRFASNTERLEHQKALIAELKDVFAARTVDEWVEALLAAGVPAGPIYDYAEALETDHVAARKMVQEIPHPVEGSFKALGFPVKLSGEQQSVRYPPPLLNQHRDEIVDELIKDGLLTTESLKQPGSPALSAAQRRRRPWSLTWADG